MRLNSFVTRRWIKWSLRNLTTEAHEQESAAGGSANAEHGAEEMPPLSDEDMILLQKRRARKAVTTNPNGGLPRWGDLPPNHWREVHENSQPIATRGRLA